MSNWLKTYRLILWLILAIFVLYLVYLALVPSGQVVYRYDFSKPSQFIGPLTPGDRVREPAGAEQEIIGNPIYFSLSTPRPFDRATLSIKYRNPHALNNLEAGVLVDKKLWRYQLAPLANKLIDQAIASGAWGLVESGSTILLQRSENYNSVAEFLAKLPAKNEVALYNYNLSPKYQLANYQVTSTLWSWPYPLKADYQFYTYLNNEKLAVDFSFTDLNDNSDPDPIELLVYDQANQLVATESLADDGVSARITHGRSLNLNHKLPNGLYKVEVKANSDIITDTFSTSLSKISFINRLWLAPRNQALELSASGAQLTLQTINPASLGAVYLNQELIDLNQSYRQLSSVSDCGSACRIKLAKGDIIISMDGVFALDAKQLIDPRWLNLGARKAIPASVKYILANYSPPETEGSEQVATIDLDLTQAYREKGKYSFLISAPSLSAEDAVDDSLIISDISLELSGADWRSLLSKVFAR